MYNLTVNQEIEVRKEFRKQLDEMQARDKALWVEFIMAPAARSHHQNYKRGLLEHSGKFAMWLWGRVLGCKRIQLTLQECVKIALLHDICKLYLYKENGRGYYDCDPQLYPHHAKRSLELAKQMGYELSQKERICILLHMAGGWWNDEDEDLLTTNDRKWIGENITLVSAVQWADMKACE